MNDLVRDNQPQNLGATEETSEFASLLLQEFKPKTERAREAVETAVRTLAEQALAQTRPGVQRRDQVDRVDHRRHRRQAHRSGQSGHSPPRFPATGKRLAWPALPGQQHRCLLYTSPSPRDGLLSRMPSSA